MDYKERYEKALEVMRQWIAPCHTPEQLEAMKKSVFPELAESEDERIRKEIIDHLVKEVGLYPGEDRKEHRWLRWLEKQKEQKPNIELIQRSWYMEGYHDREFGKEPKWILKTGEGGPKHELNPRYGQPLAKEQKPAEWSEEDEEMLNSCISSIEEAKENRYAYKETDGDTSYDHEIAWLKSLRPSWKPSEEQMNALNFAITYFMHETSYKNPTELRELYEQLKRLKGEEEPEYYQHFDPDC